MAKANKATRKVRGPVTALVNAVVWLTGVLVSLAVGFGMIDMTLIVRWIPTIVTVTAGWVVVILTVLSIILAIIDRI